METSPGQRLRQWRDYKRLTLAQVSEATGVKTTTLSTTEQPGANNPSYDTITKVLAAYPDLNPDWLLLGVGTMLRNGQALTALAHTRPHGEARTTAHPTIEPTDKELAAGTPTGPYMHSDDPVVQQLLLRIAEKDRIIERQQEDIDAWRDAFRKPQASAYAATPEATPISLRPSACLEGAEAKVLEMYPAPKVEPEKSAA